MMCILNPNFVGEIQRVAGENTLDWLLAISKGHIDYLTRLPRDVLIRIVLHLGLEDITKLGRTSHQFKEVRIYYIMSL
jgi:F-box protein 36